MNSLSIEEFLDMIKERFEDSNIPAMYKIVKVPARYDGSASVVCDTEVVWEYDGLCVKMFDLDVSGWVIGGITWEAQNTLIGSNFNVVTIRMTRGIW